MPDAAKNIARFVMRRILPMRERKRRAALIAALEEVAYQTEKCVARGFDASTTIFNIALFLLIAERDIQAAKIDALTHPDPWHRSLNARIILLTVHGRDMDKVAGQKLKRALETIKAPDAMKAEAVEALRAIRKAQRKAEGEFEFLRNATIAHRDPDAMAQYRAITQLEEMKVLSLAAEFYDAADTFINLLPKIMLQSSSFPSVLAQFSNRDAKHALPRT
ncbi:MAG: hypothetical protein M3495_11220 [Pseudomonadota bacterium]|nr:hypothetical protein [Pseudomonadota bacterium]